MGADDRCCFSEFDTQEPARQECRWASHLVLSQLLSSSSAASGARMEWYAHAPLAKKAGNSDSIIADLKANRRPGGMSPEEEVVYDFITELSSKHAVSDELFERAKKRLRAAGRRSDGSRGNLLRPRLCLRCPAKTCRPAAAVRGRRAVASFVRGGFCERRSRHAEWLIGRQGRRSIITYLARPRPRPLLFPPDANDHIHAHRATLRPPKSGTHAP
jgi:hypothetical protein